MYKQCLSDAVIVVDSVFDQSVSGHSSIDVVQLTAIPTDYILMRIQKMMGPMQKIQTEISQKK